VGSSEQYNKFSDTPQEYENTKRLFQESKARRKVYQVALGKVNYIL
jgi:hypothetical protein